MKYHRRSSSGHGTVTINIGQPFKFAVSNSAAIAHFSKRSEDPPRHSGHNRTDIVDFGLIPIQFWLNMAQLYPEVTIMNQNFVVIGKKSARSSPLCPLRHCLFPERWQNWASWAELDTVNLKICSLFSGTEPWPLHQRVWNFISLKTNILALLLIE